eukprot:2839989-Prorocentrum_lima.AAC.1
MATTSAIVRCCCMCKTWTPSCIQHHTDIHIHITMAPHFSSHINSSSSGGTFQHCGWRRLHYQCAICYPPQPIP